MLWSVSWFIAQAALSVLCLCAGIYLGRGPRYRAIIGAGLGMGLLLIWAWLMHNPAVAVGVISPGSLRYIEGTGAAPLFLLVVGVIWSWATRPRDRRLAVWASGLAAVYFLNGGIWMLQSTPQLGLAAEIQRERFVRQSQDFSCVPAACATALNLLDIPTSEAQMAELTATRPGTGATLIRALDGVATRLQDARRDDINVRLLEPSYEHLIVLQPPMVTPLQIDAARMHMVTIVQVESDGAWVADPVTGLIFMPEFELRKAYRGRVLVFDR